MDEFIEEFKRLLLIATGKIQSKYFHLPVASENGVETQIYRERVYTYELYHQLRNLWEDEYPFSLGGEVDKTNHPLYRDTPVNRLKPDLLVHIPGNPDKNLIVLEVKPVNALKEKILKDLCSLDAFLYYANYKRAFYLVYGNDENQFNNFKAILKEYVFDTFDCGAEPNIRKVKINMERFELYWQKEHSQPAVQIHLENTPARH